MSFQPSALSYADAAQAYKLPISSGGSPSTPDGQKVTFGSGAHRAIEAQINSIYGPFPRPAGQVINYRDVKGYDAMGKEDGYIYRQLKDGNIFIQVSGYKPTVGGTKTSPPEKVPEPTVGSGVPLDTAEGTDWKRIAMLYGIPAAVIGISFGVYWFYGRKK
jgi:hypothetical protein